MKKYTVHLTMNGQKVIWKTLRERRDTQIGHIIRKNEWKTTIIELKIDGRAGTLRTPFMKDER